MKTLLMALTLVSTFVLSQSAQAAAPLPADVQINGKPAGRILLPENGEVFVTTVEGHRVFVQMKDGKAVGSKAVDNSGKSATTSTDNGGKEKNFRITIKIKVGRVTVTITIT